MILTFNVILRLAGLKPPKIESFKIITSPKQLYFKFNSSPINELGNWCYQRLVGALQKYQAQQGGSMAAL